jgi:hypothetical protein
MDNQQEISWDDLMNIIDYSQYNNKIEGDILNEDVKLNDCINNKFSYKRTYNEMMQFSDSNKLNPTISSSNGKKLKLK